MNFRIINRIVALIPNTMAMCPLPPRFPLDDVSGKYVSLPVLILMETSVSHDVFTMT